MHGDDFGTQKDNENSSLRKANEHKLFSRNAGIMLLTLLTLTACENLGIRDYFANDQVPQSAKDALRLVASPPAPTGDEPWPRLGEVPSMPKDFSPKPVYNHYMDELAYDRGEAQAEKKLVQGQDDAANALTPSEIEVPKENAPVPPQFMSH